MFAATYLTYAICLAIHICMPQTFYAIALAPMGPAESALRYASRLAWVALGVVTWFGGDEAAPEPDRLEGVPGKDDLSDRERLIVQGLLDSKTLADLARGLGISPSTVAT